MGRNGLASSHHYLASAIGVEILRRGGNAVDAAVAVSAALGVVEPAMTGPAGTGNMLIFTAADGQARCLDFSGRSPSRVGPITAENLYFGATAPMVPGNVGGGSKRSRGSERSIRRLCSGRRSTTPSGASPCPRRSPITSTGWPAGSGWTRRPRRSGCLAARCRSRARCFDNPTAPRRTARSPTVAPTYRRSDHRPARGARRLALNGRSRVVRGRVAGPARRPVPRLDHHDPAAAVQRDPDPRDPADPRGSRPARARSAVPRLPACAHRGDQGRAGRSRAGWQLHPTRRRGALPLGRAHRAVAGRDRAAPSDGDWFPAPQTTTHFCVGDADGNLVSSTQTLGAIFGSCAVVEGTGLTLNGLLFLFDADPAAPNHLAPNKKVDLVMSPVLARGPDGTAIVVGSPGGQGSLQTIVQMLVDVIDFGLAPQQAVEAPRLLSYGRRAFIDKFGPDRDPTAIAVEDRSPPSVRDELARRGHTIELLGEWSHAVGAGAMVTRRPNGVLEGGADPRRDGLAAAY